MGNNLMETIPYINYSLYQMFLIFCFWGVVGWCIDVVDIAIETGKIVNRGFLHIPLCPIYGLGMLMISVLFKPISNTVVPLFFASLICCTAWELLVGWGLEKLFHARWWDYSHMKYNYKGYICLRNSLLFGVGCIFTERVVQPNLERAIAALPGHIGAALALIMAAVIAFDTVISLTEALRVKRLKKAE